MENNTLKEVKEWMRVEYEAEDSTIESLIHATNGSIKKSTGLTLMDIKENKEAVELYKTLQKMMITNFYENRDGSKKIGSVILILISQLSAYKE